MIQRKLEIHYSLIIKTDFIIKKKKALYIKYN